ncbi:MAG: tRNA uridine-5-carboxymethylaminomethyl(34) synthesis GTPase MnmE [Bacteroidales bacterium]
MMEDTIVAVSTPAGIGAIALVRLSGPAARDILHRVFVPHRKGLDIRKEQGYTLHYGIIREGQAELDDVVVTLFRAPRSYTGEDLVEIACHGSAYIQREILNLLVRRGARTAKPGEFTQRAFLNGKMDLSQAEAVADLIASTGRAAHRLAISQIRGGFSRELSVIRGELLHFVTLIELELDFSEEDVEFADRTSLKLLVDGILDKVSRLAVSFELGNAIKSGVPVAIVGETNVGKSTLLNTLLKEEKAIVSEIAGTTRDVIEDCIHLQGIEFRFIDTAGIRETLDQIEHIGIGRSYAQMEKARIILLLADATAPAEQSLWWVGKISSHVRQEQHLIILVNKADLNPEEAKERMVRIKESLVANGNPPILEISAKQGTGLARLEEVLLELVHLEALESSDAVVSNARHYAALVQARTALERTRLSLDTGISGEFLAQDIREALHFLGEITGEITTDEVLGNIFRNFCIGK